MVASAAQRKAAFFAIVSRCMSTKPLTTTSWTPPTPPATPPAVIPPSLTRREPRPCRHLCLLLARHLDDTRSHEVIAAEAKVHAGIEGAPRGSHGSRSSLSAHPDTLYSLKSLERAFCSLAPPHCFWKPSIDCFIHDRAEMPVSDLELEPCSSGILGPARGRRSDSRLVEAPRVLVSPRAKRG